MTTAMPMKKRRSRFARDSGRVVIGWRSGLAATSTDRPATIRTGWDARKLISR